MRSKETKRKGRRPSSTPSMPAPALNVVLYRDPGPDDRTITIHAQTTAKKLSVCGTGGGLGFVTLVGSDFDRLWDGINRGDALGTAYSVLPLLGPSAEQFVGRHEDFIFGWIDGADEQHGNVLLLQIIPRPHILAMMN